VTGDFLKPVAPLLLLVVDFGDTPGVVTGDVPGVILAEPFSEVNLFGF
jgi:hypothetical protein